MVRNTKPSTSTGEVADEVLHILRSGLDDPAGLERKVKQYLNENGVTGAEIIEGR